MSTELQKKEQRSTAAPPFQIQNDRLLILSSASLNHAHHSYQVTSRFLNVLYQEELFKIRQRTKTYITLNICVDLIVLNCFN